MFRQAEKESLKNLLINYIAVGVMYEEYESQLNMESGEHVSRAAMTIAIQ